MDIHHYQFQQYTGSYLIRLAMEQIPYSRDPFGRLDQTIKSAINLTSMRNVVLLLMVANRKGKTYKYIPSNICQVIYIFLGQQAHQVQTIENV